MSASTKDPHIAVIDAFDKIDRVKRLVKVAKDTMAAKIADGYVMTKDDRQELDKFIRWTVDEVRRIQNELDEETNSHGRLN